jgi:hypothetical protein
VIGVVVGMAGAQASPLASNTRGGVDLGGAADRLIDGVNQANPIYAVAIQTIQGAEAAEKGDFEKVGRAGVDVVATVAMTVLTLKGGLSQSRGPAAARGNALHGNSKVSTNAQHVYQILRTDSKGTKVHKYGVSGGRVTPGGLSVRAENQVRRLNALAEGKVTYEASIVQTFPTGAGARAAALALEKALVDQYKALTTRKPDGNKFP